MGDINSSSLLDYEVLAQLFNVISRVVFMAAAMQNIRRPNGGAFQRETLDFLIHIVECTSLKPEVFISIEE